MSFTKKTWKDRQSEYPTRRKLVSTGTTDEYDVTRAEGSVSQEGDAFNAVNMNDLEDRINAGFEDLSSYKFYNHVNQLGLTLGEETLDAIMNALPDHSILLYSVSLSDSNMSEYPVNENGIVEVKRLSSSRIYFEYTSVVSQSVWKATYFNSFSGWKQVALVEYDSSSATLNFIV